MPTPDPYTTQSPTPTHATPPNTTPKITTQRHVQVRRTSTLKHPRNCGCRVRTNLPRKGVSVGVCSVVVVGVKAWCWVWCCEGIVGCVMLRCWCWCSVCACVAHANTRYHRWSPNAQTSAHVAPSRARVPFLHLSFSLSFCPSVFHSLSLSVYLLLFVLADTHTDILTHDMVVVVFLRFLVPCCLLCGSGSQGGGRA